MSGASKKRRFLSPNRISELVWDSGSEGTAASSDSTSEDKGGFQDEPGVSHLQPDCTSNTTRMNLTLCLKILTGYGR